MSNVHPFIQEILDKHVSLPVTEETELEKAQKKIKELYHFIEMTEALTYDKATATRIQLFLKEEGLWN